MNWKTIRTLALALAAALCATLAAPRDAEAVSLYFNNRWKLGFNHSSVNLGSVSREQGLPTGAGDAGMNIMNGGMGVQAHVGVGFGKNDGIVIFLGFGLNRLSALQDVNDGDDWSVNYTQFGLRIGGKFYLLQPRAERAIPFILVDFYKYFSNVVETDDADPNPVDGDLEIYRSQLNSPLGFEFAFGAEYFINDQFSIGGEFIGFDFGWAGAQELGNDYDDLIETRTSFSIFTSLTMTWRFGFNIRAEVEYDYDYDYDD